MIHRNLSAEHHNELLNLLKNRFAKYINRHPRIQWEIIQAKLEANPQKLIMLFNMEQTGGEPDVVNYDELTDEFIFIDCSTESPIGRRSLCYDSEALESRKDHKPKNSALNAAAEMGIELLTESKYRELQELGEFDLKSSSWVKTPTEIRELGGALFCDRRYNHVFVYHNGAESYYSSRGFRGLLRV